MLTAAARNKLKRRIVLQEDEITSCVFGEMQYLPIDVIWHIFNQLTKYAKIKYDKTIGNGFCDSPDKIEFEFWPRWETKSGSVEPDLVVHFFKDNKKILNLIVEIKWDAVLSPPCQLIRQWSWKKDDKIPWMHLYLVKDTAKGWTEVEDSLLDGDELCEGCKLCTKEKRKLFKGDKVDTVVWRSVLGCIGWSHLVAATISNNKIKWGGGVSGFFYKQGIIPFTGFASLKSENIRLGAFTMDGKTILASAKNIPKATEQIDSMIKILKGKLIEGLTQREKEIRAEYWAEDGDYSNGDWMLKSYFWDIALLKGNRKRKPFAHIAIHVIIYDEDEEENIQGWEPSLYISYSPDEKEFNIDELFWLSDTLDKGEGYLLDKNKFLWHWETNKKNDSWAFCIPLVKMSNEKDIVNQIVEPVMKLIHKKTADAFPEKCDAFRFIQEGDKLRIIVENP